MGNSGQDYSSLIDPRTRPDVHIVAAVDEDSIDLGETTFENNRARLVADAHNCFYLLLLYS